MTGGDLKGRYTFSQLHFHWGEPNLLEGSEHTIDEYVFPLELHLVHVKESANNTDLDRLAVLGILFKI